MVNQKTSIDADEIPDDSGSPRARKEQAIQRYWFDNRPQKEQTEIIKPHFNKAHPHTDDVKKAIKDYDNR